MHRDLFWRDKRRVRCGILAAAILGLAARAHGGEPLKLTCPSDTRTQTGLARDTTVTGSPTVTGGCVNATLSYSDSATSAHDHAESLLVRNWTVVDSCGNKDNCVQRIYLTPGGRLPRLAVLPLENLAEAEEGARVLARLLENAIMNSQGFELVSPAAVDDAILRARVRQPYLMDSDQRQRLSATLKADCFLVGSVLAYESYTDPYAGPIPIVSCTFQLQEASTGKAIWSQTFHAVGNDHEWLFGLGVEHDGTRLANRLVQKAVRLMVSAAKVVPRSTSE